MAIMTSTISWRIIGDWQVELIRGNKAMPILHLINTESLQTALRQWWSNCLVTYDKRCWSSLVIREVPYTDIQDLLIYLTQTYQTHPTTTERVVWEVGEVIG